MPPGRLIGFDQAKGSAEGLFAVGFGNFRMVVAFGRLDNQTHADGLGRDFNPYDTAIYEGPDLLDVGFELPLASSGDLASDASEVLGSATVDLGAAGAGLFACEKAHSGHNCSCLEGLTNWARPGLKESLYGG